MQAMLPSVWELLPHHLLLPQPQGPFLAGYSPVTDSVPHCYGLRRLDHAVGNVPNMAATLAYIKRITGFHEFAEFTAEVSPCLQCCSTIIPVQFPCRYQSFAAGVVLPCQESCVKSSVKKAVLLLLSKRSRSRRASVVLRSGQFWGHVCSPAVFNCIFSAGLMGVAPHPMPAGVKLVDSCAASDPLLCMPGARHVTLR